MGAVSVYDGEQSGAPPETPEMEEQSTAKVAAPPTSYFDADSETDGETETGEPAAAPPLIGEPPGDPPTHRRRRRWRRIVAWTAGGLAILLILIAIGGYATYRYYNGRIKHIAITVPSSHPQPTAAPPGTENYLLVGVDSRAGTGDQYQSQYAVDGERSDTTILAHLDKDGTTTLLSFPRDMYVKIPSYKDKNGVQHDAAMNKFNYAIQVGGPSLLVDMVQQLTGIKVDHYVQIDLEGFKKMSSAIGGVQVCLKRSPFEYNNHGSISTNLNDGFSQFHGTVGPNTLEGDNALAFVRQRYGLPNGDIDRIKRQQVFLGAVFRKATSTGTLLNPDKLFPLLNAATGALEMDKGSNLTDLRKLASRLRGLDPNKILFETVKTRNVDLSDPGAFLDSDGIVEIGAAGSAQMWTPDDLQSLVGPLGGHVPGATSPSAGASASGTSPTTGGSTATDGSTATGGSSATGGSTATDGSTTTGGSSATDGSTATGGSTATDGSTAPSSAGSATAGASATPAPETAAEAGTCANPIY